ncbi:hypothetical protein KC354_g88 [Hortaea werneckii]|nr:hypothetical protein KC354_g88 [Hortaea werneckii]
MLAAMVVIFKRILGAASRALLMPLKPWLRKAAMGIVYVHRPCCETRAGDCNKMGKDPCGRGIPEWVGMFFYTVVVKHSCIDKSVVTPHLQFWYVDLIENATQSLMLVIAWPYQGSNIGSHFFVRLNVVVRLILVCLPGSRDTQEKNAAALDVQESPLSETVATDKVQLEILLWSRSDGPVQVGGRNLWLTSVAFVRCFAAPQKNLALRWYLMAKYESCSCLQRRSGSSLVAYPRVAIPGWPAVAAMYDLHSDYAVPVKHTLRLDGPAEIQGHCGGSKHADGPKMEAIHAGQRDESRTPDVLGKQAVGSHWPRTESDRR